MGTEKLLIYSGTLTSASGATTAVKAIGNTSTTFRHSVGAYQPEAEILVELSATTMTGGGADPVLNVQFSDSTEAIASIPAGSWKDLYLTDSTTKVTITISKTATAGTAYYVYPYKVLLPVYFEAARVNVAVPPAAGETATINVYLLVRLAEE